MNLDLAIHKGDRRHIKIVPANGCQDSIQVGIRPLGYRTVGTDSLLKEFFDERNSSGNDQTAGDHIRSETVYKSHICSYYGRQPKRKSP
jgi:hypothetical protein